MRAVLHGSSSASTLCSSGPMRFVLPDQCRAAVSCLGTFLTLQQLQTESPAFAVPLCKKAVVAQECMKPVMSPYKPDSGSFSIKYVPSDADADQDQEQEGIGPATSSNFVQNHLEPGTPLKEGVVRTKE